MAMVGHPKCFRDFRGGFRVQASGFPLTLIAKLALTRCSQFRVLGVQVLEDWAFSKASVAFEFGRRLWSFLVWGLVSAELVGFQGIRYRVIRLSRWRFLHIYIITLYIYMGYLIIT